MPAQPFTVDQFGGLRLDTDPTEIGPTGSTDLLNVVFDEPGTVATRSGSSVVSTTATTNAITGMSYYKDSSSTELIVVTDGSTVYSYNLSTGVLDSSHAGTPNGGNNSFARYGTATATLLYVANNASGLLKLDSASWTVGASITAGDYYLAKTANSNRLVVAASGLSSGFGVSTDTVWFSDAGAATFPATNFVRLWPGDGEGITALARWRDLLFAFKQSKFAVFTGEGTDSAGNPVFNYRAVDASQGASNGAVVAGDDGLYFANSSGVYVTTGDAPVYLSRAIEPWIRAGSSGSLPSLSMTNLTLAYQARKLYVNDNTNRTTLVYDTITNAWSVWQLGATAIVAVPASSPYGGIYFGENSTKKVWKVNPSVTTDNGSAISWRWASGMYSPAGDRSRVAISLESQLIGSGTATLQVATTGGSGSSSGAYDTGSAVTMGTAPAIAEGWQQIDREGAMWQHKLSGSGQATVAALTHHLSFVKPRGSW